MEDLTPFFVDFGKERRPSGQHVVSAWPKRFRRPNQFNAYQGTTSVVPWYVTSPRRIVSHLRHGM